MAYTLRIYLPDDFTVRDIKPNLRAIERIPGMKIHTRRAGKVIAVTAKRPDAVDALRRSSNPFVAVAWSHAFNATNSKRPTYGNDLQNDAHPVSLRPRH